MHGNEKYRELYELLMGEDLPAAREASDAPAATSEGEERGTADAGHCQEPAAGPPNMESAGSAATSSGGDGIISALRISRDGIRPSWILENKRAMDENGRAMAAHAHSMRAHGAAMAATALTASQLSDATAGAPEQDNSSGSIEGSSSSLGESGQTYGPIKVHGGVHIFGDVAPEIESAMGVGVVIYSAENGSDTGSDGSRPGTPDSEEES